MTKEQGEKLEELKDSIDKAIKHLTGYIYHHYEYPMVDRLTDKIDEGLELLRELEKKGGKHKKVVGLSREEMLTYEVKQIRRMLVNVSKCFETHINKLTKYL